VKSAFGFYCPAYIYPSMTLNTVQTVQQLSMIQLKSTINFPIRNKKNSVNTFVWKLLLFLGVCLPNPLSAQNVLIYEQKFEADAAGWLLQAYTDIGGISASPTSSWISTVNWSGNGGTSGCVRHNTPVANGVWAAWAPPLTLTAGKEYYVKFGATLAGSNNTNSNRAQVRIGASTSLGGATIIMPSTNIITTGGASGYVEFTSPIYTAPSSGSFYFALVDFFNANGWSCYFDGVRIYEVSTELATITTEALVADTFCAGQSLSVPYTTAGTFNSGNTFTAQLSDASGSFSSPVSIGSASGTGSGTLNCILPAGTASAGGYRIRVTGSNPATTGTSNPTDMYVRTVPVCSASPNPADAGTNIDQFATLSWGTVAGASSYDVYFGTTTPVLVSSAQSGNTYDPGVLTLGTTYQWYIVPRNSCGSSASCSSTPWTFTATAACSANAGIITAAPDSICSGETGSLTVTGSSGAVQWQSSPTNSGYSDINEANGTSYSGSFSQTTFFRTYATNGACNDTSDVFQLTVKETPLSAFEYLQGINGYAVQFTNLSTNASSYLWDFGSGFTTTAQNPEFTFPFDGTYPVSLIVGNGCEQDTFLLDVIVVKSGLDDIQGIMFSCYPNPVNELLNVHIQLNAIELISLNLYNLLGEPVYFKQVMFQKEGIFQMDLSSLPAGMYLLELTNQNGKTVRPVVKAN
jgi:hypothetical protein